METSKSQCPIQLADKNCGPCPTSFEQLCQCQFFWPSNSRASSCTAWATCIPKHNPIMSWYGKHVAIALGWYHVEIIYPLILNKTRMYYLHCPVGERQDDKFVWFTLDGFLLVQASFGFLWKLWIWWSLFSDIAILLSGSNLKIVGTALERSACQPWSSLPVSFPEMNPLKVLLWFGKRTFPDILG